MLAYRAAGDETKGSFVDLRNRAALAVERGGDEVASSEKSLSWADALAGARFRLPLGRKPGLHGRADLAGLGSDLTWNVLGGLDVAVGKSWVLEAGYRRMDVDYDKGQGLERRVWSMTYQGPYLVIDRSW